MPIAVLNGMKLKIGHRGIRLWIKSVRHAMRAGISTRLARRGGTLKPCGHALVHVPETILVSRANKRLGNTLFVTPLICSLAATFPDASIDVLVLDPAHLRLLAGLPGLRKVVCIPRNPLDWLPFILRFRSRRYDLAVDPSVNAVSNRIAVSLCRARYKLGFAGPEQWIRLTHAAAVPPDEPHQALLAVHLLRAGIPGIDVSVHEHLEVRPDESARKAAAQLLENVRNGPKCGPEIGFFTNATGEKRLPASWWREWAETIRSSSDSPRLVQVVPPGAGESLLPGIATLSLKDLDRLAACIALFDLFVAADSGPMHLAAAAGTPTIGLFRATDPADYAPLGRHCLAVATGSETAKGVAERTLRHLHRLHA